MRQFTMKQFSLTVLGILFLGIMLFPVYWMVNSSLHPGGNALGGSWFPLQPTLDAYHVVIRDQGANLITSLLVSFGTVALTLAIAAPAAYGLAQLRLRGVGVILLAVLIAQMIPGIVLANGLYNVYNDLGLLNSIPGLIFADATNSVPFAILILRAFMLSLPPSLVEAARVDGAGQFRTFFSIVLPISRNSLITAGLFSFLFAWSDFIFALTLTTSDTVRPITLSIYNYLGGNLADWGPVMATSVLAAIPATVLLIFAQRFIATGALGGAIK